MFEVGVALTAVIKCEWAESCGCAVGVAERGGGREGR